MYILTGAKGAETKRELVELIQDERMVGFHSRDVLSRGSETLNVVSLALGIV